MSYTLPGEWGISKFFIAITGYFTKQNEKENTSARKKGNFSTGTPTDHVCIHNFFFIYIELTNTIGKEIRAKSLIPK